MTCPRPSIVTSASTGLSAEAASTPALPAARSSGQGRPRYGLGVLGGELALVVAAGGDAAGGDAADEFAVDDAFVCASDAFDAFVADADVCHGAAEASGRRRRRSEGRRVMAQSVSPSYGAECFPAPPRALRGLNRSARVRSPHRVCRQEAPGRARLARIACRGGTRCEDQREERPGANRRARPGGCGVRTSAVNTAAAALKPVPPVRPGPGRSRALHFGPGKVRGGNSRGWKRQREERAVVVVCADPDEAAARAGHTRRGAGPARRKGDCGRG